MSLGISPCVENCKAVCMIWNAVRLLKEEVISYSISYIIVLELHFKGQPFGTVSIKQEPSTILILNIKIMDFVPA